MHFHVHLYITRHYLNPPNLNKGGEQHTPLISTEYSLFLLTWQSPHDTGPPNWELGSVVITGPGDQPLSSDQSAFPLCWHRGLGGRPGPRMNLSPMCSCATGVGGHISSISCWMRRSRSDRIRTACRVVGNSFFMMSLKVSVSGDTAGVGSTSVT